MKRLKLVNHTLQSANLTTLSKKQKQNPVPDNCSSQLQYLLFSYLLKECGCAVSKGCKNWRSTPHPKLQIVPACFYMLVSFQSSSGCRIYTSLSLQPPLPSRVRITKYTVFRIGLSLKGTCLLGFYFVGNWNYFGWGDQQSKYAIPILYLPTSLCGILKYFPITSTTPGGGGMGQI